MNRHFKILLFFAAFIVTTIPIQAQKYIMLTDTTSKLWIGKSIDYFIDKGQSLSFSEVSAPSMSSSFQPCIQEAPNFGNADLSIWNRFRVINKSDKKWVLTEWNLSIDSLSLYYKGTDNKWKVIHSGRRISMPRRPLYANPYVFELPITRNDTMTFYFKVHSFISQYPLTISSASTFVRDSYYNNLFKGLFFGLIISVILYNLALYFILSDLNYLRYIIYLIILGLMMAELNGVYAFLLGTRLHFLHGVGPSLVALDSLAFIFFSSSLLNLKQQITWADNFYRYVCIPGSLLIVVLNLFGRNLEASIFNQLLGIFLLITMSAFAYILYRRGYAFARFYLIACMGYFLGVVIFVLKTMALLPFNYFTHNAMELGCAIMVIMFSVALGDRFRTIRREKVEAQKKITELQFSYEKELHSIEQEVQEHTREKIAQELHDNIGQLLMVMNLQIEKEKYIQPDLESTLAPASATLKDVTNQVRLLSHTLSHDFIADGGLQRSITQEIQRLRDLGRAEIHFNTDNKEPRLSKDVQIVTFRIFQEALTNVMRHANASSIYITLLGSKDFYLEIRDDGIGFDREKVLQTSNGLGLKNMYRRASLAGLQCEIETQPQKGCFFKLSIASQPI